MGRKEVRAIGFDPTDKENKDIFNIWNGYDISEEIAEKFDDQMKLNQSWIIFLIVGVMETNNLLNMLWIISLILFRNHGRKQVLL
jgi:hypothetical protein